jgi:hypothetical protein
MKSHCLLLLALCAAIWACMACAVAPVPDPAASPVAAAPVTDWSFAPRRKAPGRGQ